MKRAKCDTCAFRAEEHRIFRCNYVYLTGHTRMAEPPEKCTYFRKGKRLESPKETERFLASGAKFAGTRTRRPGAGAKAKYDWSIAWTLYGQGKNDGEISRVMGVASNTVTSWRRREGLPANAAAGGRKREERTASGRGTP